MLQNYVQTRCPRRSYAHKRAAGSGPPRTLCCAMVRLPRSLAYVCGAIVAARCGGVTHDEAMCILADSHVVFFGDSLTRFCYHGLVAWLKTGARLNFL